MRVAIINHRDWMAGGMDKIAMVYRDWLEKLGHQAVIFAQRHPKNMQTPYRAFFPEEPDRLNYRLSLSRMHQLPGDLWRTVYNSRAGKRFGEFLDAFKPDVVHVIGLPRSFTPSFFDEAKSRDIPLIQTHQYAKVICPTGRLLRGESTYCRSMPCIHGNTLKCVLHRCQQHSLPRSIVSAVEFAVNQKRYAHQPDIHLACSRFILNLLREVGVPEYKLHHHPNFVDTQRFYPLAQEPQNRDNFFLYFGRLAPEKGIETLIDAFAPLKHLKLYLAGSGPLEAYCHQRIEFEGLMHIRHLGNLDEAGLVPWLQHARASIIPSLWGEAFGLTIIESMACRTPVIGSRVGAIAELITPDETGLLVEPGNAEELREAILKLARRSWTEIRVMGQAGLEEVKAHYTLEHHMNRLMEYYQAEALTV